MSEETENLEIEIKLTGELETARTRLRKLIKEGTEANKAELKELVATIEELKKLLDNSTQISETISTVATASDDAVKKLKKSVGEDLAAAMGAAVGMTKNYESTLFGMIGTMADSTENQEKFVAALETTFSPANIAVNIISKMVESSISLAHATNKAFVSFNESTGALRTYGDVIDRVEKANIQHFISIGDVAESMGSMVENIGGLKNMHKDSVGDLANHVSLLTKLGVSADTTTASFNILTNGFNMSKESAMQSQNEMYLFAQEIGRPVGQMMQEFQQALPKLAAFGTKANSVFKRLAMNAQHSGLAIERILAISDQFDKFDSAAESVGKLNAILGGPYLSTMKMIRATDPTERMRLLSKATREAGKSFDTMGYYEKKAVAAAMGLADVSELALVMNDRFDLLPGNIEKSADELVKMKEQAKEFTEVTDMLQQIMREFTISMAPMVKGFTAIVGGMFQIVHAVPIVKVALAGLAIAVAITAIAISVSMATASLGFTEIFRAIVVAIAAIGAAIALLMSYFGDIKEFWNDAGPVKWAIMIASGPIAAIWLLINAFAYLGELITWFKSTDLSSGLMELSDSLSELTWDSHELKGSGDSLSASFLSLGEDVLPILADAFLSVATAVAWSIKKINTLWQESQLFRVSVYTLGVVILAVAAGLAIVIAAIATVIGILVGLALAASAAITAIATVFIGLIVVSIGLMVAVISAAALMLFAVFFLFWRWVISIFIGIWNWVSKVQTAFNDFSNDLRSGLSQPMKVWNKFLGIIEKIKEAFREMKDSMAAVIKQTPKMPDGESGTKLRKQAADLKGGAVDAVFEKDTALNNIADTLLLLATAPAEKALEITVNAGGGLFDLIADVSDKTTNGSNPARLVKHNT